MYMCIRDVYVRACLLYVITMFIVITVIVLCHNDRSANIIYRYSSVVMQVNRLCYNLNMHAHTCTLNYTHTHTLYIGSFTCTYTYVTCTYLYQSYWVNNITPFSFRLYFSPPLPFPSLPFSLLILLSFPSKFLSFLFLSLLS